ncbi:MAG: hypothetical protein OEP95_01790 [Myxococcales bacterium]|nr:hypothetical protein [Myxococcales bacterium]
MIGTVFQTPATAPRTCDGDFMSRTPRLRSVAGGLVNATSAGFHGEKVEDIPPVRAMAP